MVEFGNVNARKNGWLMAYTVWVLSAERPRGHSDSGIARCR